MKFFNQELKRVCYLPEDQNQIVDYFNDNEDATLVVSFDELLDYKETIDFDKIIDIKIKKLMLSGINHLESKLDVFLKLPDLKELDNRNISLNYNFKYFPNLEKLVFEWNKNCSAISSLRKLTELSLWNYKPKSQDLSEFSTLNSLKELRIIQSNITSVKGIENLENITEMIFIANRNLSLDDINSVFPNVEILHIESCKGIKIEKVIELFPNVKDLNFFSSNEIESLQIILSN